MMGSQEDNSNDQNYLLALYVSGMTIKSQRAIENIRLICAQHLEDRNRLEIIDIFQQPELAKEAQIVATPTLVKLHPLPIRKIIGDLSQTNRILDLFDIIAR